MDYKGQKPGQVIINADEGFFGPIDNRLVNALIFMVDLFPVLDVNPKNNHDMVLETYKTDASSKIAERVRDQTEELPETILDLIFDLTFNPHRTYIVKILINKIDILSDLAALGCIPELTHATENEVKKYAEGLYKRLKQRIERVLEERQDAAAPAVKLSVEAISVKQGIDGIKDQIFAAYINRFGKLIQ